MDKKDIKGEQEKKAEPVLETIKLKDKLGGNPESWKKIWDRVESKEQEMARMLAEAEEAKKQREAPPLPPAVKKQ